MNIRRSALLLAIAALGAMLVACGNNSSAPPVSLAFTTGFTPPASLNESATTPLAATITNGPQNATVNWTATCSLAQCGSFSPTSTASTVPTTYTAPTTVPAGGVTVTITATYAGGGNVAPITAMIAINAISVTFAPAPPTQLLISGTTNIAATVTNDSNNAGVNWTVTCGSAQCGSFSLTHTASGQTTAYTAPADVPTGTSVTITATSADSSANAQASVTIFSNVQVTFTFGPPTTPMNTNTTQQIAATITNDPNNAGVTWTVTCGSIGECGSFNPTSTSNNVPTTYTAPVAVPTGNTVTVTATSVTDYTKSQSGTITIAAPPTTLPDGTYVFQLSGQDANDITSPFFVAGAFTIQGGVINGGEQDFNDFSFEGSDAITASGSTITTTADGNIQIVLNTNDTNIGPGGNELETLNLALVTSSSGLVTWFDGFAAGSGTISPQVPSAIQALPTNGYAFLASGYDVNSFPVAIGGVLNIDDLNNTVGTISGAGSVFDFNASPESVVLQNQTFNASTVQGPLATPTTPDSFGRVTFTLNPNTAQVPEIAFVGYVVNANTIALVETSDTYLGTTGGIALGQGSNTGKFDTASLSGSSYAVGAQGEDSNFFLNFVGSLTFKSNGSVSGTTDFNDLTLQSSFSQTAGNYTVDATGTGRATITDLTGTNLNDGSGSVTLQLYLDGNGNALVASMDNNDVTSGPAYQQTAGASFSGTYTLGAVGVSNATDNLWSAAGTVAISGGNAKGFTDFDYFGATTPTFANVSLTGTASSTTGTLTGLGADSIAAGSPTSDTFDFYIIDSLRVFGIETDFTQLGLLYFAMP